jgi:hypothetical protein
VSIIIQVWSWGSIVACSLIMLAGVSHWVVRTLGEREERKGRL